MMERQAGGGSRLERASRRLAQWRREHGGRGVRLPAELWAEAVELARLEGLERVARSLRIAQDRLAARVAREGAAAAAIADGEETRFVELDAGQVCAPARTVVRMDGRNGERIEIELADGATLDIVGLARALWDRPR